MAETENGDSASLENTPTWAVAVVCIILITVSLFIEHGLHLLAKYLQKKRKKSLLHALNKIKSDLMLLGFISLLLTVVQKPVANICIPKSVIETFLPCESLTIDIAEEESKCQDQMRRWKSWEAETRTVEYKFSNDPRRFQLIHQTSFGRRHLKCWSEHRFLRLPVAFLRQFYQSVSKVDYFTLRHGFISAHFTEESDFDFQKYLKRALEKDFGVVVGMSIWIWMFSVLFIFFNAYVFHNYIWLPFIPVVMLLLVGTKLQAVITKMCLDCTDKSHVIRGVPLVRPGDHFFWFAQPKLILHLMHFILFQNSFQLAFFTWTWYKFGLRSCFHRRTDDIATRLVMGVIVHILCGYVTLPLYALVTQMGTSMKDAVFPEAVISGLERWRARAKKKLVQNNNYYSARPSLDASLDTSLDTSKSICTIDGSLSVELAYTNTTDDGYTSVEIGDGNSDGGRQMEQDEKRGSFQGFDLGKMQ